MNSRHQSRQLIRIYLVILDCLLFDVFTQFFQDPLYEIIIQVCNLFNFFIQFPSIKSIGNIICNGGCKLSIYLYNITPIVPVFPHAEPAVGGHASVLEATPGPRGPHSVLEPLDFFMMFIRRYENLFHKTSRNRW